MLGSRDVTDARHWLALLIYAAPLLSNPNPEDFIFARREAAKISPRPRAAASRSPRAAGYPSPRVVVVLSLPVVVVEVERTVVLSFPVPNSGLLSRRRVSLRRVWLSRRGARVFLWCRVTLIDIVLPLMLFLMF